MNEKIIEENSQYTFLFNKEEMVFMFRWKFVDGLDVDYFEKGITAFALLCKEYKPRYAVIDASELDQNSPAVAWLHGRISNTQEEDYMTWWLREIVPIYHDSGIVSLAVGTGDPNAPGELSNSPPEVKFKIGYFQKFESALQWKVE